MAQRANGKTKYNKLIQLYEWSAYIKLYTSTYIHTYTLGNKKKIAVALAMALAVVALAQWHLVGGSQQRFQATCRFSPFSCCCCQLFPHCHFKDFHNMASMLLQCKRSLNSLNEMC